MLGEAGRRYLAPRRYDSLHRNAVTARAYRQAAPVVVTTLKQLQEHGAGAAVWRRLGLGGEQTLTDALDSPDGHALYREQEARADAEDKQRRAAEREAERPVCKRRGGKCTDERRQEITVHRTTARAGDRSLCPCRVDDVTREAAAAEAARLQAATPPEPEHDQEPDKPCRGLFRHRG